MKLFIFAALIAAAASPAAAALMQPLAVPFPPGLDPFPPAHHLAARQGANATVTLPQGTVVGSSSPLGRSFIGIPYATANRWEAPVPNPSFNGTLNATGPGVCCEQPKQATSECGTSIPISEQCLQVNVFAPPQGRCPAAGCPVMVWIHGGSLVSGSAMESAYNGAQLANAQNVTVAAINYRLGPYGFPPGSAFLAASNGSGTNYGFQDARAGLTWVKNNIAAFGGDPSKITVFGESAGSITIGYLILNWPTPAFNRAIMESGTAETLAAINSVIANSYYGQMTRFLNLTGLSAAQQVATMKALPTIAIDGAFFVGTNMTKDFGGALPMIDGIVVKDYPRVQTQAKPRPPLEAVMIGTNQDEGTIFVGGGLGKITTNESLQEFWAANFGPLYPQPVTAVYSNISGPFYKAAASVTDGVFEAPTQTFTSDVGAPIYLYRFNSYVGIVERGIQAALGLGNLSLGAYHSAEIPFVFDGYAAVRTAEENATQKLVQDAWGVFARGGEPWPRFVPANITKRQAGVGGQVQYFARNGTGSVLPQSQLPDPRPAGVALGQDLSDLRLQAQIAASTTTTATVTATATQTTATATATATVTSSVRPPSPPCTESSIQQCPGTGCCYQGTCSPHTTCFPGGADGAACTASDPRQCASGCCLGGTCSPANSCFAGSRKELGASCTASGNECASGCCFKGICNPNAVCFGI